MTIRVKRAAKYGFCSGVRVADRKVRRFVAAGGRGAILGQVVHNERVVEEMERLGMRTVASLDEVEGGTIVFSAHGVPPSFHEAARRRGLEVLDTTCKFVYDIHRESREALEAGEHLVFIGDPNHREVVGYTHDLPAERYHVIPDLEAARAVDWSRYPAVRVFFQTTLNADDYEDVVRHIEAANPNTRRTDTICYATKENQQAARELARDPEVDLVLVIGGKHSANTRHLWEITSRYKPSYLIQGAEDIRPEWLEGARCVGVTAGASTPDAIVEEVEARLQALGEPAPAGGRGGRA
ncbi:MAG: 4-hydroxy-3-methylbut-2-enyl diphosphate reductase [Nitrospirae bacterium]|nr:MAG: 4-hydroxy-3-methylbut-2-enyl diphosphate reductase [Nitrospirota bacterium]